MRCFLLVTVFFDQLLHTHFRQIHASFAQRFKIPKLYHHSGAGMASPSWMVYERHGYDQKMDWEEAQRVADVIVHDILSYLAENNGQQFVERVICLSEQEIHKEFDRSALKSVAQMFSLSFSRYLKADPASRTPEVECTHRNSGAVQFNFEFDDD